jgi:hypothetical protein
MIDIVQNWYDLSSDQGPSGGRAKFKIAEALIFKVENILLFNFVG